MSASAEAGSARPAERPPAWENLLYTLKAGPAGGRLRRPSSAGIAVSPSYGAEVTIASTSLHPFTEEAMPQSPDYDAIWRSISNSPLISIYTTELYWLARNVAARAEALFEEAKPASDGHSYIQVNHNLLTNAVHLLGDSARIKALITPSRKSNDESQIKYQIRLRRTAWLRNTILEGIQLKCISDAKVRHSLEHFDEYIDETAIKKSRPPDQVSVVPSSRHAVREP
jgi:hypothetical protein